MGVDDETRELDRVALAEFTGACCKPGQWTPPQMRYFPPGRPVQPTMAASVRAGVAFLDERFPGWQDPQPGDAPWFQQVWAGDQRCLAGEVMRMRTPAPPSRRRRLFAAARRFLRALSTPTRKTRLPWQARPVDPVKAFPRWFEGDDSEEETWW